MSSAPGQLLAVALASWLGAGCTAVAAGVGASQPGCPAVEAARGARARAGTGEHSLLQRPRALVSKTAAGPGALAASGSGPAPGPAPGPVTEPAAGTRPSVVELNGFLRVEGNAIVSNKTQQPVHLRGMSLFWSQWRPQFWTNDTVHWLRDDWNATLVRAAMAVEEGGYLEFPQVEEARVRTVVEAAIRAGIYVIVDWHDHNAEQHLDEARAFFGRMAERYGRFANVLFEVFNEPVRQEWGAVIKPYHQELVRVIRQHSDNLVILGTRLWSQEVEEASLDPVEGENLAYTVHFYASTHRRELRHKVERALANGAAIFATEWGTCDASGDGSLDLRETQDWLDFFARHHISDANWAIGDKDEACAALRPGASGEGGWDACALSASGAFVRASLRGEPRPPAPEGCPTPAPRDHCAASGTDCSAAGCCRDPSLRCFQKDAWWASCRDSCTPGIDPRDPPEHRSPWSCALLE